MQKFITKDTSYISERGSTWYLDGAHRYTVIRTVSKLKSIKKGIIVKWKKIKGHRPW